MIVYIIIIMFMGVLDGEDYTGAQVTTGINQTHITGNISGLGYEYQNSSSMLEPVRATTGFLNTFLDVTTSSLTFGMELDGAPDIINLFVRTFFFILSWLAFYDLIIMMMSILVGVVGRLL